MTDIFSEKEVADARRAKKVLLIGWFVILVLYVALLVTMLTVATYLVNVHRNRDHTFWMGAVTIVASVLFGCYSLFFFSIKFRLTRKFVRMLKDMQTGLRDEIVATFSGYDENVTMKDGVYFYAMVVQTKPLRREDITERKVLIEHTKLKPDIPVGARVRLISHANILMSYELA